MPYPGIVADLGRHAVFRGSHAPNTPARPLCQEVPVLAESPSRTIVQLSLARSNPPIKRTAERRSIMMLSPKAAQKRRWRLIQ